MSQTLLYTSLAAHACCHSEAFRSGVLAPGSSQQGSELHRESVCTQPPGHPPSLNGLLIHCWRGNAGQCSRGCAALERTPGRVSRWEEREMQTNKPVKAAYFTLSISTTAEYFTPRCRCADPVTAAVACRWPLTDLLRPRMSSPTDHEIPYRWTSMSSHGCLTWKIASSSVGKVVLGLCDAATGGNGPNGVVVPRRNLPGD
jgi:hypothetical protein